MKKFITKKAINIIIKVLIILFSFTSCSSLNDNVQSDTKMDIEIQESSADEFSEANLEELGGKIRDLNTRPGINDVVIMVNGYPITRKDIEVQKIYDEFSQSKSNTEDIINSLIRYRVIKCEADRLNVNVEQSTVSEYIGQIKKSLENKEPGTEVILSMIKGAGATIDEYINVLELSAYDMFQRDALRKKLKKEKSEDFEAYIDELVQRAEIEFLQDII